MPRVTPIRPLAFGAALVAVLAVTPAWAAQIVAYDLKPIGSVKKELADSLSPVLINALSKREGMSVVSQSDIKALLALETDKQMMGCDQESCLADIADSMGAELLATSTLAKVGRDWVVSVTLLQVDGAKVLKRSTIKEKGEPADAITRAIEGAVHEIFRDALPKEISAGPASLTRRGFEAALAGLHANLVSKNDDPRPSRRKVVLDLVNTELDYDTAPKYEMLDAAINRGMNDLRLKAYDAKNKREVDRLLWGMAFYRTMLDDLGRVKEIRERARAKGLSPSSAPLRFLDPELQDPPESDAVNAYFNVASPAQKVLASALTAFNKKDAKGFVEYWSDEKQDRAIRQFANYHSAADKYRYSYSILPKYAVLPTMQERALDDWNRNKTVSLWVKRSKKGSADSVMKVTLKESGGSWRIENW